MPLNFMFNLRGDEDMNININIRKFIIVVVLLVGIIALLTVSILFPGLISSVIHGETYSQEAKSQADNFNSSNETPREYNKNASEMLAYINDGANFSVSQLFYASESIDYMNVTGIILDVRKDERDMTNTIYFASGYNITAINAKDFPFYPENVHSYRLKKIRTNDTFYYLVEDVKIISKEEFVDFYKQTLNSDKMGTMEELVGSVTTFTDNNVTIGINGSQTVFVGDVDSVESLSPNNMNCMLKFKGGLNMPALNGCTFSYQNVTKVIAVTNKIRVKEFTFVNIESIYSVEGQ